MQTQKTKGRKALPNPGIHWLIFWVFVCLFLYSFYVDYCKEYQNNKAIRDSKAPPSKTCIDALSDLDSMQRKAGSAGISFLDMAKNKRNMQLRESCQKTVEEYNRVVYQPLLPNPLIVMAHLISNISVAPLRTLLNTLSEITNGFLAELQFADKFMTLFFTVVCILGIFYLALKYCKVRFQRTQPITYYNGMYDRIERGIPPAPLHRTLRKRFALEDWYRPRRNNNQGPIIEELDD